MRTIANSSTDTPIITGREAEENIWLRGWVVINYIWISDFRVLKVNLGNLRKKCGDQKDTNKTSYWSIVVTKTEQQ